MTALYLKAISDKTCIQPDYSIMQTKAMYDDAYWTPLNLPGSRIGRWGNRVESWALNQQVVECHCLILIPLSRLIVHSDMERKLPRLKQHKLQLSFYVLAKEQYNCGSNGQHMRCGSNPSTQCIVYHMKELFKYDLVIFSLSIGLCHHFERHK